MDNMKKIYIIRTIILGIIAFAISNKFFSSSVLAMLIVLGFFELIVEMTKYEKRKEKMYMVAMIICSIGAVLFCIGNITDNDMSIIIGAMLFSCTYVVMIVKNFTDYIKERRK